MKSNATWTLLVALVAGSAGCAVPEATVDARNLTAYPPPTGHMIMLPPLLAPQVTDPAIAAAFISRLTGELAQAGLDVAPGDLGGKVRVRTGDPAGVDPQWLGLGDLDRARLAAGTSCRTICQPVVVRYGNYSRYAPAQGIGEYGVPGTTSPLEARSPGIGPAAPPDPGGPLFNPPNPWSVPPYARARLPGIPDQLAQVQVVFHVFYPASGQRVYYVAAMSSSVDVGPGELEGGFAKPLAKLLVPLFGRHEMVALR